jgi:hypothetical protein
MDGGVLGSDAKAVAIPLPAPLYLGLSGFAFVISASLIRKIFF